MSLEERRELSARMKRFSAAAHTPAPAPSQAASTPLALQVTPAAYQLPWGISREVVLASVE